MKDSTPQANPEPTVAGVAPAPPLTPSPMAIPGRFDLSSLRLSQDFAQVVMASKKTVTVPVRKPGGQDWFRAHRTFEFPTFLLDLKEDREAFLVAPDLWGPLQGEITPRLLVPVITRSGVVMIWPLRMPASDGRLDDWSRSALEAMQTARSAWTRMTAKMALGAYEIMTSTALTDEPTWPKETPEELIQIGFRDQVISTPDHPAVRRLRGEI